MRAWLAHIFPKKWTDTKVKEEHDVRHMALSQLLFFRPTQASLHLGVRADGAKRQAITFVAVFDDDGDVETPERRSLRSVKWTLRLEDSAQFNDTALKQKAIGILSHFAERKSDFDFSPEECFVSAAIGPVTFKALLDGLVAGRLPQSLIVSVQGMTYGSMPDGSVKVWDVAANETLFVHHVDIHSILIAAAVKMTEDQELLDDEPRPVLPATSADIQTLGQLISKALADSQQQAVSKLKFLVAAVVAILLVLLLK